MKKLISLLIIALAVLPVSAQIRGNNIVVKVSPDHKDWNYKAGEKLFFSV